MNERIKELAKALAIGTIGNWGRVEWKDNVYPQLGDKLYAAIDLEKFAELIVRECCSTLSSLARAYDGSENDSEYANALDDAANIIQEHFGVDK